jgi:hypothetical protein
VNAQQQRTAKDKEVERQKEQEQEEKEKVEAEEKSRTSSNASSHKDEPVVVNGSVETTTAESANDEKEVRMVCAIKILIDCSCINHLQATSNFSTLQNGKWPVDEDKPIASNPPPPKKKKLFLLLSVSIIIN